MLVLGIVLSLPSVQTKIAQYFAKSINKDYGTNISIDEVAISVFGGIKFKKVLILDHHKDTLIFSNRIKTNILDGKKLLDGDLIFGDLELEGLLFNLKTYKSEKETNLDKFIAAFGTGKPSKKHFLLKADKASITNGRFILTDENRETPKDIDFTRLNTSLSNFKLYGAEVNTIINKMSFKDYRGIFVENLSSIFSYTKKKIKLEKLDLLTKESWLKGDVALNYKIEDFKNFTDKVQFDVKINSASLASNDIRCFYNELGKNQHFNTKAIIKGTLNNLKVSNLKLFDAKNSQIIGNINFKNLFGNNEQKFYMNAKLDKLSSSYDNLVTLLPTVLGKKLPSALGKLGKFTIVGNTQITTTTIDASVLMITELGKIKSDLSMTNIDNIDNAFYKGNVVLEDFALGTFLNRKDLGNVSLDANINGKGFSQKYLKTSFEGDIFKLKYNGYNYKNIVVNGNFEKPIFRGNIKVNDPNLIMDFDGVVDLSKKSNHYDFDTKIGFANLKKLNFMTDSISNFKGNVKMNVSGSSLDNLIGDVYITNTSYQNKKDTYNFDDFELQSSFDYNNVRTITINSPDIIEGKIVGKFQFNLLRKMIENSVGSLYTNYRPNKIKKGQFLKFNFTIYNKIIEIFYPGIAVGKNTSIYGNINSDNDEFKFNFDSPQIVAFENYFDNLKVQIDNKNPLYNTYIELDSIRTKNYKVRDFSLINVTMKDTLFLRSEFKGGNKGEDIYNLNLYHTINEENKNVVGIKKSEVKFKDYLWFLNENNTSNNKVVFDKSLKNFSIDNIIMSHENETITLLGNFENAKNKDLKLSFKDVNLNKITPDIEKFKFEGLLNGDINIRQKENVYQPTSNLQIEKLKLNSIALGNLNLELSGNDDFSKFNINSSIENENVESFNASGNFEIQNKETILDLQLKFDKFNLATLNSLGGDVISNIRGFASGNSSIQGNVKKPEINGRLYADNAGMTIPYLNVDYELGDRSIIDLTSEKFLFRNNTITDTKFNTKGTLNGSIEHKNFSDWKLDLAINSKRLLALNTKDSDDAAYYGVAFINGNATIKGPTSGLFIKVAAKSEKGTAVKIPINDAESVSDNNFIHFLSPKGKFNLKKGITESTNNYNGLELEFDFDITPDAEVEVILDRNSGHGMKGKGNGTLLFKINTLGKFNMWGDFQAYEGTYNFKYGGIIDKKFAVKKGGSITWEGNPMKAQLNLEAVYKTTANPAVLLDNSSFNKKVPVEVVIGVHGDLASPEPNFTIEFPTVSNVLKSEIQYKLNDKDVRQTQALYLLSSGGFLSPEGVSRSDFSGSLFETASSLLGGIIGTTDNEKLNLGFNFISADKRIGRETDGRFEATISSKINERITINGKVGVPIGGINQSAIVGNVEVLYRVNEDGTLNLRLFNRENDINYIGQGIGYTQGAGISYEVDFDTFKELVNKLFKHQKLERENKPNIIDQDSNLSPDYIDFSKPKKPTAEKPKTNQEGIIPDEE